MKANRINHFILEFTLCLLISGCSEEILTNKDSMFQTGSVMLELTLPPAIIGEERTIRGNKYENKVDYPSDFQIGRLDIYLFGSDGHLVKSYKDVKHQLSQRQQACQIRLDNAPAGKNQTLLYVANPENFPELNVITLGAKLEDVLQLTTRPFKINHTEATLFMAGKSNVDITPGRMSAIIAVFPRGMARLDIATGDEMIRIDSLKVENAKERSFLYPRQESGFEKRTFNRNLSGVNRYTKIAYLNESEEKMYANIWYTYREASQKIRLEIPTIKRNNIYTLRLETRDANQIEGTIAITEWGSHVIEGSVKPDITLNERKTLDSFSTTAMGVVGYRGGSILMLPRNQNKGTLYFTSGSEISISHVNPADTVIVKLKKNSVSRGDIQTSYQVDISSFEDNLLQQSRDIELWAANLMTGKGQTIILRQNIDEQVRITVPKLDFDCFHEYSFQLFAPQIEQINDLSTSTDDSFEILLNLITGSDEKYKVTVRKKRIYDPVLKGRQLTLFNNEVPFIAMNLHEDTGFSYEEITIGEMTFMDRDLGATSAKKPGELFAMGTSSLIPLDQQQAPDASFPHKIDYIGFGRLSLASYLENSFSVNLMFGSDKDPCPKGWHIMRLEEIKQLFSIGNTDGQAAISGTLKGTVHYNNDLTAEYRLTQNGKTNKLIFNANIGYAVQNGFYNNKAGHKTWPTGWWVKGWGTNNKYYNLSFNFETVSNGYRAQLRDNFSKKMAMPIRCVKDRNM